MAVKWSAIYNTIQGAAHKRNATVCQDSSFVWQEKHDGLPLIAVAADGHGSKKYVRSDIGSKIACDVAFDVAHNYCNNFFSARSVDFNLIKDICCQNFKRDVISTWVERVLSHVSDNVFSEYELLLLSISRNDDSDTVLSKIVRAYGSTLIIVIVLETFILLWKLGDGDIIFYYSDGRLVEPIDRDLRHIANETSSLCSSTAFSDMNFNIQYLFNDDDVPNLIMLATDGYSNSFSSKNDFYRASADFYKLITTEGLAKVACSLEEWLIETSEQGAGDDISLILIYGYKKD